MNSLPSFFNPSDVSSQSNESPETAMEQQSTQQPIQQPRKKPESWLDYGLRNALRSGARFGEGALGGLGDLASLPFASLSPESKEIFRKVPRISHGRFTGQTTNFVDLPTSEGIKENITDKIFGEYLKPKSKGEESSDEVFRTIGSLFNPGGAAFGAIRATGAGARLLRGLITSRIPLRGAAIAAVSGKAAEEGAKALGVDESNAKFIGSGITLLSSIGKNQSAGQFSDQLYDAVNRRVRPNSVMPSRPFASRLQNFINETSVGGVSPDKAPAIRVARQLLQNVEVPAGRNQHFSIRELIEGRRNINSHRWQGRYGAERLSPASERHFNRLDEILNSQLDRYGRTRDPAFLRAYREANEVKSALFESDRLARRFSTLIQPHTVENLDPEVAASFGMNLLKKSAGTVTLPLAKSVQIGSRILRSPGLRRYYAGALRSASEGNAKALNAYVSKFNDIYVKQKEDEDIKKLKSGELKQKKIHGASSLPVFFKKLEN